MKSKIEITIEDLLNNISSMKIKNYQKQYLKKILTEKKIDVKTFSKLLELPNIHLIEEFLQLRVYPSTILNHISMISTNRMFYEKIKLFTLKDDVDKILCSYFQKEETDTKMVYDTVLKNITKIWKKLGKDPSFLLKIKDLEPLMQNLPRYRDHFIHSFNVFILGHYIIRRLIMIIQSSEGTFFKSNNPRLSWMLTSTFHDIAYPIQQIELLLNTFFKSFIGIDPEYSINVRDIITPIYYDFLKFICNWHKNPLNPDFKNIQNIDLSLYDLVNAKLLKKDHGVISALILLHLLGIRQGFLNSSDHNFLYVHLPASHSICLHNLDLKIDFTKYPLAFLLILCDEIQDWGRPTKEINQDLIYLYDINIDGSKIPTIIFNVAISENRGNNLKNILSKRLQTSHLIKVKILNLDGDVIVDI